MNGYNKKVVMLCGFFCAVQLCLYESVYAMEAVFEAASGVFEKEVFEGIDSTVAREILNGESIPNALTWEFGAGIADGLEKLPEGLQNEFVESFETAFRDSLREAAAGAEGFSMDAFKTALETRLETAATSFETRANRFGIDFGLDTEAKSALREIEINGRDFALDPEIRTNPENYRNIVGEFASSTESLPLSSSGEFDISADAMHAAIENLGVNPQTGEVVTNVPAQTVANFHGSGEALVSSADADLAQVATHLNEIEGELEAAQAAGEAKPKVNELNDQFAKVKRELKLAEEQGELAKTKKLKEYLDVARKRVLRFEEIQGEIETELAANPEDKVLLEVKTEIGQELEGAKTDLSNAGKEYREGMPIGKLNWEQRGRWALDNAYEIGKGKLSSYLIGGGLALGGLVFGAIEVAINKKDERKTLNQISQFGTLYMQILPGFVNEEEPSASRFVYWGVDPQKDDKGTPDLSKPITNLPTADTANYYTAYSNFGTVGEFAITDPLFGQIMIHLNTGLVFNAFGNPVEDELIGILKPVGTGKKSLSDLIDSLALFEVSVDDLEVTEQEMKDIKAIDAEFTADKTGKSKLIMRILNQLRQGTAFGSLNLTEARALNSTAAATLGIATGLTEDPYFIANGYYVYQTQDTPVIQQFLRSSAGDEQEQLAKDNLYDYVVCFDEKGAIVPLQTPQITAGLAPAYRLNPKVAYVVSLLDPDLTMYDQQGKAYDGTNYSGQAKALLQACGLEQQVNHVKSYISQKNGPFQLGSVTLTIDKTLLDAKIPVYKAAGFLENGGDDYFVITQMLTGNALELPLINRSTTIILSLVTSRVYDSDMAPMAKDPADMKPYFVLYNESTGVKISSKSGSDTVLYSGQAPLYSIFVDGPVNPNTTTADQQQILKDNNITPNDRLPQIKQWALSRTFLASLAGGSFANDYLFLQNKNSTLLDAINVSHDAWVSYLLANPDDSQLNSRLGPFTFAVAPNGSPITIWSTGINDIRNAVYVYMMSKHPGEYFVLSGDINGNNRLGSAYDKDAPQQYAISLTTGNVYDSLNAGDAVGNAQFGFGQLNTKPAINDIANNAPDLWQAIVTSQNIAQKRLLKKLVFNYGNKRLYIARADFLNNQFIYGDVTGKGDPLDAQGNEVAAVVNDITHYYVARNSTSDPDAETIGSALGAATQYIIDVTTLEVFGQDWSYVGSYQLFDASLKTDQLGLIVDSTKPIDTILAFVAQKSLKDVNGNPLAVRLKDKITTLATKWISNATKERKQLQTAQEQEAKRYPPLSELEIKNLLRADYLVNDRNDPRYLGNLKKMDDGFWVVSPRDTESPELTSFIRLYTGKNKKTGQPYGTGYNAQGKWAFNLQGWALTNALARVGVEITADGKQSLTIAVSHPVLPMTYDTDKKTGLTAMELVKDVKLTNVSCSDGSKRLFELYYNKPLDAYFIKTTVTSKTSNKTAEFYIDFISGYAYNLDGSPYVYSGPLFVDSKTNNYLFQVLDPADDGRSVVDNKKAAYTLIAKDAFDERYYVFAQDGSDVLDILYPLDDGYGNTFDQNYKCYLRHFTVVADIGEWNDLSKKIDGYLVYADKNGIPLAQPFWLLFSINADTGEMKFAGKYELSPSKHYTFLTYLQTINPGQKTSAGQFVTADAALQPFALVLDYATGAYSDLLYDKQVSALSGSGKQFTAHLVDRTITLTKNDEGVSQWYSLADSQKQKVYNCEPEVYFVNPQYEWYPSFDICKPLSLYALKHNWNVNISSFIPNALTNKINQGRIGAMHTQNLFVHGFSSDTVSSSGKIDPHTFGVLDNGQEENLKHIHTDSSSGTLRYLYQFGQEHTEPKTCGTTLIDQFCFENVPQNYSYFSLNRMHWWVDLSNGVLFDDTGYPVGYSLLPGDLYLLLDVLGFSVSLNKDQQPTLIHRVIAGRSDNQGVSVQAVTSALPKPLMYSSSTDKTTGRPQRLKKLINVTRAQEWKNHVAQLEQSNPEVTVQDISFDIVVGKFNAPQPQAAPVIPSEPAPVDNVPTETVETPPAPSEEKTGSSDTREQTAVTPKQEEINKTLIQPSAVTTEGNKSQLATIVDNVSRAPDAQEAQNAGQKRKQRAIARDKK